RRFQSSRNRGPRLSSPSCAPASPSIRYGSGNPWSGRQSRQPSPSSPLLRELREMVDRLAVVLHGNLHVRFDEVPRFREISVSDPVALADRPALVHVHLVQEVHLLQFVDVTIDRRLRRLQLRRELFHGPPLIHPAKEAFDEE